jgi:ABC-2 type transport system ATP-binding protein
MIEAFGLTKYFGPYPAIRDVSFRIEEGEIVAFLGPNAAGKTTTMRILTCYTPATFGTATIAGHDIYEDSIAARRQIGYLPENAALYTDMNPIQYLSFLAKLRGVSSADLNTRLDDVIDKCKLDDVLDVEIGRLSKGYRQRVCLAQAMVHDPPVLILDEPTVGLDPNQIIETRSVIRGLAGDHTVMISTHILSEAQLTCERVIVINQGQIVAEDSRQELTHRLREADVVFLRVKNTSPAVRRELQAMRDVRAVRPEEDGGEGAGYYIEASVGADLRSDLAEVAVKQEWGLLELRRVDMTLEDAFIELTREEAATTS